MALLRRTQVAQSDFFPGFADVVELGVGTLATVYRAREIGTNRNVALKLLNVRDASPQAIESFERESIALGAVSSHPNIVTLYRSLRAVDGRPVLVLELCSGSIGDRTRPGQRLPVPEVVSIGIKIAGALETAHRADILHRDVKPQNILMTEFGEPALADFGVAMLQSATQNTAGLFDFTTLHAAPELLEGGDTSAATDVYELASTIYQLIAGRSAFRAHDGESPASVILRILRDPVQPLGNAQAPAELSDLLIYAMSKDKAHRPTTAAEFATELAQIEVAQNWPRTQFLIRGPAAPGASAGLPSVARMPMLRSRNASPPDWSVPTFTAHADEQLHDPSDAGGPAASETIHRPAPRASDSAQSPGPFRGWEFGPPPRVTEDSLSDRLEDAPGSALGDTPEERAAPRAGGAPEETIRRPTRPPADWGSARTPVPEAAAAADAAGGPAVDRRPRPPVPAPSTTAPSAPSSSERSAAEPPDRPETAPTTSQLKPVGRHAALADPVEADDAAERTVVRSALQAVPAAAPSQWTAAPAQPAPDRLTARTSPAAPVAGSSAEQTVSRASLQSPPLAAPQAVPPQAVPPQAGPSLPVPPPPAPGGQETVARSALALPRPPIPSAGSGVPGGGSVPTWGNGEPSRFLVPPPVGQPANQPPRTHSGLTIDPMSLRKRVAIRSGLHALVIDEQRLVLRAWWRKTEIAWPDIMAFELRFASRTDSRSGGHLVALTRNGPVELPTTRRPIADLRYVQALLEAYRQRAQMIGHSRPA